MAGGRPTKFKEEYIEALVEFFDIEPYTKEVTESSTEYFKDGGVKRESHKYRLTPNKMPTLFGFARKIGVAYSTVWRWAEKGDDIDLDELEKRGSISSDAIVEATQLKEFCNAYKEAKELQKEFLISIGLVGAAPPSSFIFTAKNVTDMRDKTQSNVELTLPTPLLNNVLSNNSDEEDSEAEEED